MQGKGRGGHGGGLVAGERGAVFEVEWAKPRAGGAPPPPPPPPPNARCSHLLWVGVVLEDATPRGGHAALGAGPPVGGVGAGVVNLAGQQGGGARHAQR